MPHRPADPAADPFADDPPERDPFAPPPSADRTDPGRPAAGRPAANRRPATLDPDRVVYVPSPSNPWKAAALVFAGIAGGSLLSSVVWGVVLLVAVGANGGWTTFGPGFGGGMYDGSWDESNTTRLAGVFGASAVVTDRLGPVSGVVMNEGLTYSADAEWDEYFYDVTGEEGSGTVRVRFLTEDTFSEADLTLPDGTVVDLDLPGEDGDPLIDPAAAD